VFLIHSGRYLALLDSGRCLSVTSRQRHRALGGCVMQSSLHRVGANPQFIIPVCVVAESAHDIFLYSLSFDCEFTASSIFSKFCSLAFSAFFLPSFAMHMGDCLYPCQVSVQMAGDSKHVVQGINPSNLLYPTIITHELVLYIIDEAIRQSPLQVRPFSHSTAAQVPTPQAIL
jgi:hypothetical protein